MNIRNIKIGKRVYASFALILAFKLTLGLAGAYLFGEVMKAVSEFNNVTIPKTL